MNLLLLASEDPHEVLPALDLLPHRVRRAEPEDDFPVCDTVLLDARAPWTDAAALCARVRSAIPWATVIVVSSELSLESNGIGGDIDELILAGASPAEVEARLRLLRPRPAPAARDRGALVAGDLVVDDVSCTVRLSGRLLELTRKEYQLLRHLAQRPGRLVSRAELLTEIWTDDAICTERTVDVHILRLRDKLGPDHRTLIRTARGRGYKFVAGGTTASGHSRRN
ncbi:response regulator transcription factor [Amycolatopsis sp. YIM 10]|uniref:winged helix-turn-helix transcriptional regulator n=1 Tax=Amycolatopsis sp. YIM 10 TaxID=2653857 RepID=UPI00128FCFEE|nr:response regulator transcription factor [Amycolatopsis sp. YIM 10]QFU89781.1 Transcriptional regulatory protein BaeR [Amycolatopsis sp. YIM 10]